jgi:hypothetical protein
MLIKHPQDLNKVFGNHRITSYAQLRDEIIPPIQMLKNSSGLEYLELYRGQGLDKYKLDCGLSRYSKDPDVMREMDAELQERFEEEIYADNLVALEDSINKNYNPSCEKQWKLNFQAQHLGLKTRLMDWSINWKIGLMFAVANEDNFGKDGQLWIFYCPRAWRYNHPRHEELYTKDLNSITEPHLVNMAFLLDEDWKGQTGARRATRQSGRFLVQSYEDSVISMEDNPKLSPYLIKLIIDGDSKKQIKEDLSKEGPDTEWAYYRTEDKVDQKLKDINNETIEKYG